MKFAIIGYGKMGKTIHRLLENQEVLVFNNQEGFETQDLSSCSVAIEFSNPEVCVSNILKCFEAKVPVVVGTTAWYNDFENVKKACKEKDGAIVYATNFSIGVNIFFELNKKAAELMNNQNYEVSIKEIHHTEKKDAPSGTAISLANDIIAAQENLETWSLDKKAKDNSLPIFAERLPEVKGTHFVKYSSEIDDIELSHTAHSREGFAKGSIAAAKWIMGKKGVFSFREVLGFE